MKKLLVFISIVALAGVLLYFNQKTVKSFINSYYYYSPCDTPVTYSEGRVDPRFGISSSQFLNDMNQATGIWDNAYGKKLYAFSPNAPLVVSLVYDNRQSLDTQINTLQGQLNSDKQSISPQISQYNQMSSEFKQKLTNLNSQIAYWNSRGGAPPSEYKNLIQEQQSLQNEASQLNAMAQQLNQTTDSFNAKVGQLNQTVNNFNAALAKKPEEGLYNGVNNTITIYFDDSQIELIHTLAHEFGHSLGMIHNQNPNSIMYPYTNQAVIPSNNDMADLDSICKKQSVFTVFKNRFVQGIQNIKTLIQAWKAQGSI